MKLIKPDWVTHNGKPLFCIDVHPDGTRFATGGHGEDCGSIIIWNMAPVISPIAESDENVPKILCQMDDHAGCVNCLRWSNNGNYLVSGGDDKVVVIWTLSKTSGSSSLFGSFGSIINIETWKSAHVLRGHLGDILDVNWSPDDSFIATGSVDNTVIIWNAQNFPEILKTIKGHEGLVKGVVFDPVGKYMASQSDDRSLCIWNVSDWSLEKKIKEPFTDSSGTTHVLRLHWSPDGQFIVSAHAMNNGGPVAKIIERNGWKVKKDFVGHRKAITCVRFSERMLMSKEAGKSRFSERMLMSKEAGKSRFVSCGIGSRDRSLSIWLTSLKRPLAVVHDLFENSLMDIAWSKCGYILFACSLDGTVACLQFSEDELGKAVSNEEKLIFHKKTFGTSIKSNKSLIFASVHETSYFTTKQNADQKENKANDQPKQVAISQVVRTPSNSNMSAANVVSPFKASDKKFTFSSNSIADASSAKDILEKQKETKTKDGKRRIVPLMLDSPGAVISTPSKTKPETIPSTSPEVDFLSSGKRKHTELSQNTTPVKKSKKKEKAKKAATPEKRTVEERDGEVLIQAQGREIRTYISHPDVKDKVSFKFVLVSSNGERKNGLIEAINNASIEKVSFKFVLVSSNGERKNGLIEAINNASIEKDSSHFLKYYVDENLHWNTVLPNPITDVVANRYLTCVACSNKSLHVFSNHGRRLLSGIVFDSHISMIKCELHYVMVITSSGYVNVWNIRDKTCLVKTEKLNPLFTREDLTISSAYMNDSGYPIISLSDESTYVYDITLSAWCELSDNNAYNQSEFTGFLPDVHMKGPLNNIQTQFSSLSQGSAKGGQSALSKQLTSSIAHIESQMCSALLLQSPDEYRFWLMTYVRYLVQIGDENRIRELCEEFLHSDNEGKRLLPLTVFKEHEMLREILTILAADLNFKRIHAEIQQQLDMIT